MVTFVFHDVAAYVGAVSLGGLVLFKFALSSDTCLLSPALMSAIAIFVCITCCTLALHFCVDCLLACHCQFVFPELSYLHFRYCHIFISIAQLTIFILWLCRFVDCFRLTFVVITFSTSNFTLAFYCEFYNDLRSI